PQPEPQLQLFSGASEKNRLASYSDSDLLEPGCNLPEISDLNFALAEKYGPAPSACQLESVMFQSLLRKTKVTRPSVSKSSTVAARDTHGRSKRTPAARSQFMRQSGFPKGRKEYVVDHIVPL